MARKTSLPAREVVLTLKYGETVLCGGNRIRVEPCRSHKGRCRIVVEAPDGTEVRLDKPPAERHDASEGTPSRS